MICMLLVFLTGFYLMSKSWGPQPWLVTSVIMLLSTIPVSIVLTVIAKKEKRKVEGSNNAIPVMRSIYKTGTALVILILMVFKNTAYNQTLTIVTIAYLPVVMLSFHYFKTGKRPDSMG